MARELTFVLSGKLRRSKLELRCPFMQPSKGLWLRKTPRIKRVGKGGRQPKLNCFVARRTFSGTRDRHLDSFVADFYRLMGLMVRSIDS
jgi:hypothetical protein